MSGTNMASGALEIETTQLGVLGDSEPTQFGVWGDIDLYANFQPLRFGLCDSAMSMCEYGFGRDICTYDKKRRVGHPYKKTPQVGRRTIPIRAHRDRGSGR